ncbi:lysylphosphatidylglycerol synthase transmembrane domain-containing protein [Elusimicrobiota bacterium]
MKLKIFLGIAFGAVLMYFAIKGIPTGDILTALKSCSLKWIALAILVYSFEITMRGVRLKTLLGGKNILDYSKAAVLGLGVNCFIPLRAGEVAKIIYIHKKTKTSLLTSSLAIVCERILDVIMLGTLIVIFVLANPDLIDYWTKRFGAPQIRLSFGNISIGILIVLMVLALISGIILYNKRARKFAKEKIRESTEKFKTIRKVFINRLGMAFLATLGIWFFDAFFLFIVSRGFESSIHLSMRDSAFMMTTTAIASLPALSPGSIGIVELLGAWAMDILGRPPGPSLAFVVTYHAMYYVMLSSITIFVVLNEGINLSKIEEKTDKVKKHLPI